MDYLETEADIAIVIVRLQIIDSLETTVVTVTSDVSVTESRLSAYIRLLPHHCGSIALATVLYLSDLISDTKK